MGLTELRDAAGGPTVAFGQTGAPSRRTGETMRGMKCINARAVTVTLRVHSRRADRLCQYRFA